MSFEFKNKNVEDAGRASGEAFAKGLGVGLGAESYRAITAVEGVYVELESLTKNAAKNAEKLAKKQQERKLDNLKNALKLELICEQEYYERLKVFRDENLRQGSDAWYKCTEEIAAYNKRLLDETQKQYEKIIELRQELAEKLSEKLVGNESWLVSEKVTFKGMGKNGTDLVYNDTELKNFREEVALLENYRDRLTELKSLGNVPQEIFADIAAMNVQDGLKAASYLLSTDEMTRNDFFSAYAGHRSMADKASLELLDILYGNELGQMGAGGLSRNVNTQNIGQQEEFIQVLEASFEQVPKSYYDLGQEAGKAFGNGFLLNIPEIMEQVKNSFTSTISELGSRLAATFRQGALGLGAAAVNTYNTTYTFNSSKDTTTQQLRAAKSAATLDRLRGGNVK